MSRKGRALKRNHATKMARTGEQVERIEASRGRRKRMALRRLINATRDAKVMEAFIESARHNR
jgi:hypothetical protein